MEKKCPSSKLLPWQRKMKNQICHMPEGKARQFFNNLHCWLIQCPYRNWK